MSHFRRSDYRPAWTHDEKMVLIEMAEKFQVLWDTNYPFFRELTQRKHALEEIYTVLDGRHTVEDINAQWRNLKDVFHKKKTAVEQATGPDETASDPSWRYYGPLKFLLSCEEERKNNLRKRFEGYEIAQLRQMRFRRQTEIAARRKEREDEAMTRLAGSTLADVRDDNDDRGGGGEAADEPPAKRSAGWPSAASQLAHPRPLHDQRIPRRPSGSVLTGDGSSGDGGESTSSGTARIKHEEEDFYVGDGVGVHVRHPMNLDAWARPTRRGQPPPAAPPKAFVGSAAGPTRPAIISSGAAVPPAPAAGQPSCSSTAAAFPSAVVVKTETIDDDGEPAESPPDIDREEEGPTEPPATYMDLNDEDDDGNEDSDAIECLRPTRPAGGEDRLQRNRPAPLSTACYGPNRLVGPLNATRAMYRNRPEHSDPGYNAPRFLLHQRRGFPLTVRERPERWLKEQPVGTTAADSPKPTMANGSATVNVRSAGDVDLTALTSAGPSSSSVDKFKYFAQYVESALLDINQQSPAMARRLVQDVYASVAEYQAMLL